MRNTKPLVQLGIKSLFLVWGAPHGTHRSELIAEHLGMDLKHIYVTAKRGRYIAPFKYSYQLIATLVLMVRERYQLVFIQDPPVFAILAVYLYSLFSKTHFVIDAHTDALLASWWAWLLPLHRFLSRRAITTIVTNDHLQRMVASWNAHAFVLTDVPLTSPKRRQVYLDGPSFNVVMISTASYDEPIAQVLEAASKLPDIGFCVTGSYEARRNIIESAPANVHFTGYVADEEFYGLLEAAQAVICLTTENHTIQSGASEALWLGKPIITSDWPILREYFDKGTIHVDNTAESIYRSVVTMRDNLPALEVGIRVLQEERRREWWEKANCLIHMIEEALNEV